MKTTRLCANVALQEWGCDYVLRTAQRSLALLFLETLEVIMERIIVADVPPATFKFCKVMPSTSP